MGKVFTITEGLENMGALRTGGQGSVYKGRRIGEIITAVKLLPTPIHTESEDDKNYRDFQNEVEKLRKVNEDPSPNVVKILASGITESGSFPFIEMEFIEGPDLEELLKPPHDSVFTIKEVIKVADHLANALEHCHKVEVKHGDIKSNNVKLNIHTGNYVLLDFGLAIMSDEQRRTSMRHAGAIEFMAPEQNEGAMLFQTDIYSYGIILYELLAGQVPFPLKDGGQTSRNNVMVSHMEAPVPDVLAVRNENMPDTWPAEKKEKELLVPQWLLAIVAKCLDKDPQNRFANGMELHQAVIENSISALHITDDNTQVLQGENDRLRRQLHRSKEIWAARDKEIILLKEQLHAAESTVNRPQPIIASANTHDKNSVRLSKTALFALLFLLVGLASLAAYSLLKNNDSPQNNVIAASDADSSNLIVTDTASTVTITETKKEKDRREKKRKDSIDKEIKAANELAENQSVTTTEEPQAQTVSNNTTESETKKQEEPTNANSIGKYTLAVPKAHFHNEPDESTRRAAFINHWNKAILTPTEERDGFVYIIYTNHQGQTSKGWMKKSDLKPVND